MKGKKLILLICCIFSVYSNTHAQKGNYFIHNYLPSQYQAADQNRCILQDLYGRIFVANNDGLLINNGSDWDKYPLPFLCFSLAKDENETIFIAGDGNFGKIINLSNGSFKFESLTSLLPDTSLNPGRIWSIITLNRHVYFCSNEYILDYDYKKISIISPGKEGFHTFYKVEDRFIVREKGKGLKFLSNGNEFVMFKGGEIFADNENPVRGIIKGKDGYFIITPASVYEFSFNKVLPELSEIKKCVTPIDNWLKDNTVYCATAAGNQNYAFGSVNGGLLITDEKFQPVKYINTGNTLQDDGVNFIYNDNQGHIWLALAKGISLIEFNSPITGFAKSEGVYGTIESCSFYKGSSFLATDKGLLKHNDKTLKFEPTSLKEAAWSIATNGEQLLAGTDYGLFLLSGNEFIQIYESPRAIHSIFFHPNDKNIVFIGTESGFAKLNIAKKKPEVLFEDFELNGDIRTIAADMENIYFGTTLSGIYKCGLNENKLSLLDIKNGLPNLNENYLFSYKNEVLIATDFGIYKFTGNEKDKIVQDDRFNLFNNRYIIVRAIAVNNDVWLNAKKRNDPKSPEMLYSVELNNGKFQIKNTQLSRIKESDTRSFCTNGKIVYIGTNNGLYCYDLELNISRFGLNTFINSMTVGKDTTKFLFNIHPKTNLPQIELNYNENSVEIKAGASDYIDKNELQFSYFLQGRDTGFCAFTNNKVIKLEYLHEGDYVFVLKSKNILGLEGQEIKIPFSVLPPWYRTTWAYALYIIALISFLYLIIKLNLKRLREQNIKLENIITERTKEINEQKLLIEHKNREITDSINYAKGIQDSILPGINEIKKQWKDVFVFFKPKDIVSGDFYWYKQLNNYEFLIACADCTGHGVPGGFMSMICSDKLNDATRESSNPDKILFLANNSIKETLRQQSEGKSKDGMEIALVKVNTQTKEITYSGANRQLWILDADTKTIREIKPTKAGIASFTEFNFTYESNTLQLKTGDIIYMTSDGYPDQFGGMFGKKYMSKNFKIFLLKLQNKPIHEQEILIKNNIEEWMGTYEQVDDLLVIGIKM